jgi:hypothetical protein
VLEISNRDLSAVGIGNANQASFQSSSISRVNLQTVSSASSQPGQSTQQQLQQQQSTGSASASANDDDSTPILLQVLANSFNESLPVDSIRIDPVANNTPYFIKNLSYVYVTVVDSNKVSLDLVELLFKESYLNGNDMLRIKKHLVS